MFGLVTYSSILLALIIGALWRPTVGVAAILCLFGLKQWGQSSTAFLAEHSEFTNFAIFFVALFGLFRAAQRRSCVFCQIPVVTVLILALYIYAFISITWTLDPAAALDQWLAEGPYVVTVAFLAPLLFSDFKDTRTAFTWTALTGTAICILVLAFGAWGNRGLVVYGHEVVKGGENIYEYETNPLAMSSLAGTVVIITTLWFARPNRTFLRVLAVICIPIAVAVILRTGTRGQLIATGAALVVALPIAFRLRELRSTATLLFAAVLVAGMGWWATSLVEVDSARWESSRSAEDVAGRFANAELLLRASTADFRSTLFGLGNSSAFKLLGIYPHITGLEVIAEEGLIGAVLYFAILFLAVRSITRIISRPDFTDLKRNVLAMITGLFVFELLVSWKQGSLLISVYVFAYAIILARLESPIRAAKNLPVPEIPMTTPGSPRFQNLLR
jgi:hypothetical protein